MAKRRNITIPDDLDAEVNRLKDQINVSGVCAEALQREVERLQATSVEDQRVVRMLRRFEDQADFSYGRGYDFGAGWATMTATRGDLDRVLAEFGTTSNEDRLKSYALDLRSSLLKAYGLGAPTSVSEDQRLPDPGYREAGPFPDSADIRGTVDRMIWQDVDDYFSFSDKDKTELSDEEERERLAMYRAFLENTDLEAFLEGWRDAPVELWGKVKPLLATHRRRPTRQETTPPAPDSTAWSDAPGEETLTSDGEDER